jgi:isoprenylcysteine carboxyl methyltransferase (ICMT) family protein YpbQ
MRPESIVNFERFYVAGIVVGLVNTAVSWNDMKAEIASDAAVAGMGNGVLVATVGFTFLIQLLFWYLIARCASNIAKWIMIVLFVVGLLFIIPMLFGSIPVSGGTIGLLFTIAITVLQGYAIYFLFKPDAVAWLKGEGPVDPNAFN